MLALSELFTVKEDGSYNVSNVAELLTSKELDEIAQKVKFAYEQDLTTCSKKFEELDKIMDLAMIVTKQKSYPWQNASNIIYPLISTAAINFGASCYPEIIQDSEVVKPKIIGSDDGKISTFEGEEKLGPDGKFIRQGAGEKLKKGERVATMMNWQLLEQMNWWESDLDKEVHSLPILGTMYKKVYYDSLKKMPISELIFPNRIVINNGARDIDSATVSQIIELYPQEILERIRSGYYVNFDFDVKDAINESTSHNSNLNIPKKRGSEQDTFTLLHTFIEQHTWMDLDEDGFLEPWIITIDLNSSKTVRIAPRFKEKDIIKNSKGEIQEIKACKYFVVRRFLPSFDGSFLGIGFGYLLFNINNAINTTLNQMVDAGHLSITGGGFIGKNVKIKGGKISLSPNEYKLVDVVGGDLASNIFTMPRPEPSSVLITLLTALVDTGKDLGSMRDVLNGEGAMNIPATTYMGMVDQGHKQFKSIFKRYYKSLKTEFKLLYDLNSEYLTQEEYADILDQDQDKVDVKGDFALKSYDIVPVADVNSVVSSQKYAQSNFLMQFIQDPYVDGLKLRQRIFETARIEDPQDILIQPQPQPNPLLQIEQLKSQTTLQIKQMEMQLKSAEINSNIETEKANIEKIHTAALVDLATVAEKTKKTDLLEQSEQVRIYDNILEAQTKAAEIKDREQERKVNSQLEILKLIHDGKTVMKQHDHELELAEIKKIQEATKSQPDNINKGLDQPFV